MGYSFEELRNFTKYELRTEVARLDRQVKKYYLQLLKADVEIGDKFKNKIEILQKEIKNRNELIEKQAVIIENLTETLENIDN